MSLRAVTNRPISRQIIGRARLNPLAWVSINQRWIYKGERWPIPRKAAGPWLAALTLDGFARPLSAVDEPFASKPLFLSVLQLIPEGKATSVTLIT